MAAAFLFLGGCASFDVDVPDSLPPRADLAHTPFHPQLENHCGPAALTTVLEASGIEAGYDAVVDRVWVPGLEGSLQVEMMAAARSLGRIPFRVPGTLAHVLAEVDAGHPVLVLQNLRVRTWPAWHYAVVVGYDLDEKRILMRSGTQRRAWTGVQPWMRQWDWAGRWAIVVLKPGRLPAGAERASVFRALADFDDVGAPDSRLRAWQAAALRWPDRPLVSIGIGNARFALGDRDGAAAAFREALARQPDHWPARLNLAQVLLEIDRGCDARQVLAEREMSPDHALSSVREGLEVRVRSACQAPPEPTR